MLLAYIDESGTNYKTGDGYFTDGPYAIWSGILVNEDKYFHVERGFYELGKGLLNIENWQKDELHASDIWNSVNEGVRKEDAVKKYFEELFQFIAKMHLPVVFGIQQKDPKAGKNDKEEQLEKSRYSFLHGLEHQLAELQETGILIADAEQDSIGRSKMADLVFERTKWRYNPGSTATSGKKPKFEFEFRSNFIIDQLHYVDSKNSLLIQFSDHVCFVLRRVLEHLYLVHYPSKNGGKPKPDINKVPITEDTFNIFVKNSKVKFAHYVHDDVSMGEMFNLAGGSYFKFAKMTHGVRFPVDDVKIFLQQITPFG